MASTSATLRDKVFLRDGNVCQYCLAAGVALEPDHVVPVAWGGPTEAGNLVAACARCNNDKGALDLDTYMMVLRRRDGLTAEQTRSIARRVRAALRKPLS